MKNAIFTNILFIVFGLFFFLKQQEALAWFCQGYLMGRKWMTETKVYYYLHLCYWSKLNSNRYDFYSVLQLHHSLSSLFLIIMSAGIRVVVVNEHSGSTRNADGGIRTITPLCMNPSDRFITWLTASDKMMLQYTTSVSGLGFCGTLQQHNLLYSFHINHCLQSVTSRTSFQTQMSVIDCIHLSILSGFLSQWEI